METISVESSHMATMGYEPDTKVLQIGFKNNTLYEYFDVPPNVWEEFKAAESKGKYLAKFIKGTYQYKKVETPPTEEVKP